MSGRSRRPTRFWPMSMALKLVYQSKYLYILREHPQSLLSKQTAKEAVFRPNAGLPLFSSYFDFGGCGFLLGV